MKYLLTHIIAAIMLISLNCCNINNDMIWDMTPAGVYITITDKNGNNLLDPAVEGNLVGEKMKIVYEDKAYDAIWEREDLPLETRYYYPTFYGLLWDGVWYGEAFETKPNYLLYFGEFDGADNLYMKLQFHIEGINTIFEFEYHHTYKTNWKGEPKTNNYINYNGKKIKGKSITLAL